MNRPLILISNDDSYAAGGIRQLIDMVRSMGDIIVVAPDGGRSGAAMSFTSSVPVNVRQVSEADGVQVFACTGTPCDCVKLACGQLLPRRPDLILAGINHGDNAAINVHYSGTMAIALEGAMKQIPAIGFSSQKLSADADFSALRPTVQQIVKSVLEKGLPRGVCLNVNYPDAESFKGIRLCRMGVGDWVNELERRTDPRGRTYYWVTGSFKSDDGHDESTDTWAMHNGYIAITPTQLDLTAYGAMDYLKDILLT
ncbi:MAG: 5'/3'-nucleotidase SurE [Bacteroidales bacterium]|nr:5'/3'-nucleotidase SurE [Bacteroidales bacterium]